MKALKYLFLSLFFVSIFSCNTETEDVVTKNATEGGVSVQIDPTTIGKALGNPTNPSDIANSTIVFTDVALNLKVIKRWAGEDIVKYQLYKSINGGVEVLAAESSTLPLTLNYTNINQFIAGTQIANSNALRVGDVIKFRTKVTKSNGASYFIHEGGDYSGTYSLTVSCGSNLGGAYSLTTRNLISNFVRNHGNVTITPTGVGTYHTTTTGTWLQGTLRPDQGYDFQDVCGRIIVPTQDLFNYYSNDVFQTDAQRNASFVNGNNGTITIEYTIYFTSGDVQYRDIYVKL